MVDNMKMSRLGQAFMFVIRSESYAINRAALAIQAETDKEWDDADHSTLWASAYAILSHAANLSKAFWPNAHDPKMNPELKEELQVRGALLRRLFQTDEKSPLHKRQVRNGFEHLDERLHEWLVETKRSIIDQFISTVDPGQEYADRYILRTFNVTTGIVTVGDASTDLRALCREADRLYLRGCELEGDLDTIARAAQCDSSGS